jgi:hypothetical protein
MTRAATTLAILVFTAIAWPGSSANETRQYPLASAQGLSLHGVSAAPATLDGRKGLRLTLTEQTAQAGQNSADPLALVDGVDFSSGVIVAEIAGTPAPGAGEAARGFVGIAFRVQPDRRTYDAFYLRPTNGRADDQERRNHAVQYVSHPEWPWFRLRKETPSKYEAYADLVANQWTKIKIEVRGDRARLYVGNAAQPTLVVNDVKSGASARGGVALWIGAETVAHVRDLRITP